jgi:hypothetical protein
VTRRLALALLVLGVFAAPAAAITVDRVQVRDTAARVTFEARFVSPPSARYCWAYGQAVIAVESPLRVIKALGRHKIDVCRNGRSGTTYGYISGYFAMGNIKSGRYALCIRASQLLRNGRWSKHFACKSFQHRHA